MSIKVKKRRIIIATAFMLGLNVSWARELIYVVKPGDTLSKILRAKKLKPVYGKKGSLANVLKRNPQLKISFGDKIYPGMKIFLSEKLLGEHAKQAPLIVVVMGDKSRNELPEASRSLASPELAEVSKASNSPAASNEVERTPGDEFDQSFYGEISPEVSWKNLSSTDENALRRSEVNVSSNTSYGLGATYGMHFEENVDSFSI
jgi:hypothetical protein